MQDGNTTGSFLTEQSISERKKEFLSKESSFLGRKAEMLAKECAMLSVDWAMIEKEKESCQWIGLC